MHGQRRHIGPPGKIQRAQEFLPQTCFDAGVTRIHLWDPQELRGKAEQWSLRNKARGPELHLVDTLLRSKQRLSSPKGESMEVKQIYFDFWETMEVFRTHMCDPDWRGSAYKSTFFNALALAGRLSFCEERGGEGAARVSADATLQSCSDVDHTLRLFSACNVETYVSFLADLTGLCRGHYELISISEFLSQVCF